MATPPSRALARGLCLALALALAGAGAESRAGGLYRWVTADGRVEIGPVPPPGVNALPWAPGQPDAAAPAAQPTPEPSPKRARAGDPCRPHRDTAKDLAILLEMAEREIAQLEAKLEKLEASEVAYSETESCAGSSYGTRSHCTRSSFDRDAEISRAQLALAAAEEKRDDIEQRERRAAIPPECKPRAAD